MAAFRSIIILLLVACSSFCLNSCQKSYKKRSPKKRKNTLFQVSTVDALLAGVYDSNFNFYRLKKHGDFGLGTLNKLDGELVILDGKSYQITVDGKVHKVSPKMTTPMAITNFFLTDYEIASPNSIIESFEELQSLIKEQIITKNKENYFHAIKVHGTFSKLKVRSVPKQEKPYKPLKEVIKDQSIFDFNNVTGTMVGYWNPNYIKGINIPGFHFHFISDDKTLGGHVFSFEKLSKLKIDVDKLNKIKIFLPNGKDFQNANLSKDRSEDLEKAEKE